MQITHTFHAADTHAWRLWLEQHHAGEKEVWLVFTRAHTAQPCISYEESVVEALCFGWVDSLIQKIYEDHYARKFTPRRPGSAWSASNRRRLARAIAEGRMTSAGLAKVDFPPGEPPPSPAQVGLVIPEWIASGLQSSPLAWENFSKLPPSHKKRYLAWLSSAKREETRRRNLQKAIHMLERNQRLEMNTRTGG